MESERAATVARRSLSLWRWLVRFLAYEELKNFGITHTKIHLGRLEKDNKFPKRVMVGANRVAWVEDEIIAWMKERVAARDKRHRKRTERRD
jgi:prophage regulatory protein